MNKYEIICFNFGQANTHVVHGTDISNVIFANGFDPNTIISIKLVGSQDVIDNT